MARPASRKAVSSLPAIANIDEQLDEVVMESEKQREIIASLYDELVIAKGLIKEICTEKGLPEPKASLQRIENVLAATKEHMVENI